MSVLLVLSDHVEQFAILHILHHNVNAIICLKGLEELSNSGMPNSLQNSEFARDVNFVSGFDDEFFVKYFDGNFLICFLMNSLLNSGKGASAYCVSN